MTLNSFNVWVIYQINTLEHWTLPFFFSSTRVKWDLSEFWYICPRLFAPRCYTRLPLALINRAGGLYGRILTEVVSTDRTQWGLYTRPRSRFSHTDRLSSVNKMFIIWQTQEQFNLFHVIGLYKLTFCLRTAMSRIWFFQSLLGLFTVFFSSALWHLQE